MELDLTKLSHQELLELQKAVRLQIQDTAVHKQDIGVYGKLYTHISENGEKNWHDSLQDADKDIDTYEASKWIRSMQKSIFMMCDVALNNMRVTQYIGRPSKTLERGGQSIPTEISKDYVAMANELADVIIKWHDIAEQKGYKIINTSSQN